MASVQSVGVTVAEMRTRIGRSFLTHDIESCGPILSLVETRTRITGFRPAKKTACVGSPAGGPSCSSVSLSSPSS